MDVFDRIIHCEQLITQYLDAQASRTPLEKSYGWTNIVWSNNRFRRAHLDSVDARKTKGLYMMHLCVFPHDHNSGPIYGFDVIGGKNKVTGAFHDFSKSQDDNHPLMQYFQNRVSSYQWIKSRLMPPWALAIFSPSIVAVGNINTDEEMDNIIELATSNLDYYCNNIEQYNHTTTGQIQYQNRYCHYQKQNPHTPRVMAALGLDEEEVHSFIHNELFPETE
jgi:hypothetical protein